LVAEIMRTSTFFDDFAPTVSISPFLDGAQQLDLGIERQFADLVEEQRAAIGLEELAPVCFRSRR
jgi:hypothetical protein